MIQHRWAAVQEMIKQPNGGTEDGPAKTEARGVYQFNGL